MDTVILCMPFNVKCLSASDFGSVRARQDRPTRPRRVCTSELTRSTARPAWTPSRRLVAAHRPTSSLNIASALDRLVGISTTGVVATSTTATAVAIREGLQHS
eukprot:5756594-Pleurochrysis_carterae.AAC.1